MICQGGVFRKEERWWAGSSDGEHSSWIEDKVD